MAEKERADWHHHSRYRHSCLEREMQKVPQPQQHTIMASLREVQESHAAAEETRLAADQVSPKTCAEGWEDSQKSAEPKKCLNLRWEQPSGQQEAMVGVLASLFQPILPEKNPSVACEPAQLHHYLGICYNPGRGWRETVQRMGGGWWFLFWAIL